MLKIVVYKVQWFKIVHDLFLMQDDYECTTRLICAPDWPHVCEALTSTFDLVKVVKAWHQANQIEEGPIIVIDK